MCCSFISASSCRAVFGYFVFSIVLVSLEDRNADADYVKACIRSVVEETPPLGMPWKTWQNTLSASAESLPRDVRDRKKWWE